MRIGWSFVPSHSSPEEWAAILRENGVRAAAFPVDYRAPVSQIDAYAKAAEEADILIAEVGVWDSPFLPAPEKAAVAREKCLEQFRLAEYVGARCCVNVSGAAGPVWYGCYRENYSERIYWENVAFLQRLCDAVKPVRTRYTLEVMQWMLPDSPEQYGRLLKDVDREGFAVHMDAVNFVNNPYRLTHHNEIIDRAFALLGPAIRSSHLKDFRLEDGTSFAVREVPCGQGLLDIRHYLQKIAALGPDAPVLLEHLSCMEEYVRAMARVLPIAWEIDG